MLQTSISRKRKILTPVLLSCLVWLLLGAAVAAGGRHAPATGGTSPASCIVRLKSRRRRPADPDTTFAPLAVGLAVPGGVLVQQVVHSVFFTVVSVVATLLTVGLTGVILLLVTDRDTPYTESPAEPTSV